MTTSIMSTMERIARLLHEDGIDGSRVSPATRINELFDDSLHYLQFLFLCEQEFGIPMDEEVEPVRSAGTLGQLADAIDALRQQRAS